MCYSLLDYCFSILIPFLAINPFSTLFQGKQQPPPIAATGLRPKAGQRLPSSRAGAVQGPWHQEVLALPTVTPETLPEALMKLEAALVIDFIFPGMLLLSQSVAVAPVPGCGCAKGDTASTAGPNGVLAWVTIHNSLIFI